MKWYTTVNTPSGRGIQVTFDDGESLTIAYGLDAQLHIVSSTPGGVEFSVSAGGALMVAPKTRKKAKE